MSDEADRQSRRESIKRAIGSGAVASAAIYVYGGLAGCVRAGGPVAGGVERLITLNCVAIGSQLVDNLNASIHVRALLTDLFLIDQALRQSAQEQ